MKSFVITKWCASITDSGKDEIINQKLSDLDYLFRLKDDDDIVYAYGYSKTNDDEAAFAPLDYYENDYGCTTIEYYSDAGGWETL